MKKITVIFILFLSFMACKGLLHRKTSSTLKEDSAITVNLKTITGEFLYIDNAAVLKTNVDIYGVVIDEKLHELNSKCNPLKEDKYDMVLVTIKGVIIKNPQPDGWKEIIEIKDILSVKKLNNEEELEIIIKNN
jgi:hypothetical protein